MPSFPVQRDAASAEFFDAAADGRLLIKTCPGCGEHSAPRPRNCRRCGAELVWRKADGGGTLVTWSIAPPPRDQAADGPTVFGYVELAEGPWLETLLVDVPPDALAEGLPVRIGFVRRTDDEEHLPVFRPAPPGGP